MPKSQQSHKNRRGKGRLSRIHRCVPGGIRTPDTLLRRNFVCPDGDGINAGKYASLTDEQFMLMVCMGVVLSDYSAALTNKCVVECVERRWPDLARLVLDGLIRPACPSDDQIRKVKAAMHRLIRAAIAEATEQN